MDYPRTRAEFDEFYPEERSCLRYLERRAGWKASSAHRLRTFGDSLAFVAADFDLPELSETRVRPGGDRFDRTRTPLRTWLLAAWAARERLSAANESEGDQ